MATIQVKRGLAAAIPPLLVGELGFTTDTEELYVGSAAGNVLIGPGSGGALTDGDYGDVAVSGSGTVMEVESVAAEFALLGDITPTAISADQNDYNPTDLATSSVLRLEPSGASRSITGLQGGAEGRVIVVYNISGTLPLVLVGESASSSAANRFATQVVLRPLDSCILIYDSTSSRWRQVTFILPGDNVSPGNLKVYGTNGSGTISWYSLEAAYFTNGTACSVIGRSANSAGADADIAAASNDTVLRRTSDALDFGQLTVGMFPNDVVTYAKIQNVSANNRILGAVTAGDVAELTPANVHTIINVDGTVNATITITGNTTLDATHGVVLCNNTAAITVTLPAAASHTGRSYYIKKINVDPDIVTIDANSTETIDGALTLVLYVLYDAVLIHSDGANWHIIGDYRIAHKGKASRNAAQSINTGTETKVAFDTEVYDVGGIVDVVTNDRFDIRRAGKYLISAKWSADTLDSGEIATSKIFVNGALIERAKVFCAATNDTVEPVALGTFDLAAGDTVEMYIEHTEGAAINTLTGVGVRPVMSVTELRP